MAFDFEELLNEMVDKGLADRRAATIVVDNNRMLPIFDLHDYLEFIAEHDIMLRRN